jgi:hypothetical protein
MIWLAPILSMARAVPLTAWLVAGVLVAAGLYHWRATSAAYEAGKATATQTIIEANQKAKDKADAAIQNVDDCYARGGDWSRARGVCIRSND